MLRLSRNTIRMRVFSLNLLLQNLATRQPISAVPGARFFIQNGYLKKWAGKRPCGTLRVTVEKIVWALLLYSCCFSERLSKHAHVCGKSCDSTVIARSRTIDCLQPILH